MGIPYHEPAIGGTVELISRRMVHVDGRDKAVLVYRYVCDACGWDCVRPGLTKLRRAADLHRIPAHHRQGDSSSSRAAATPNARPVDPPDDLPGF